MACAGCLRRRKKIAAAYHAVKFGFKIGKRAYVAQTTDAQTTGMSVGGRVLPPQTHFGNPIDIRETAD